MPRGVVSVLTPSNGQRYAPASETAARRRSCVHTLVPSLRAVLASVPTRTRRRLCCRCQIPGDVWAADRHTLCGARWPASSSAARSYTHALTPSARCLCSGRGSGSRGSGSGSGRRRAARRAGERRAQGLARGLGGGGGGSGGGRARGRRGRGVSREASGSGRGRGRGSVSGRRARGRGRSIRRDARRARRR